MRLFRSRTAGDAPGWREDDPVRLLLIDDDEDEYRLLSGTLRDIQTTRYELDWAPDFASGIQRVRNGGYDAYLVDYRLGGQSGVDLVRAAREHGCEAAMIMLTGESSKTVDMAAMEAGATDFLEKGKASGQHLERSLRYAISNSEMTAALRRALRQVTGLEMLGRLLSEHGPTPETLEESMRLLDEDFGIQRASLYLMDEGQLVLAAVRGYANPARAIDPRSGKLGWMIETGRPQLTANLSVDPASRSESDPMEFCLPLLAEGECLGILNVAFPAAQPTEDIERGVRVVADRLGVALALNRAIRGRSFVDRTLMARPEAGRAASL